MRKIVLLLSLLFVVNNTGCGGSFAVAECHGILGARFELAPIRDAQLVKQVLDVALPHTSV